MGDELGVREVRASSAYGSPKQPRRLRVQNARRTFGHCVGGKGPRALAERVGGKEVGLIGRRKYLQDSMSGIRTWCS